MHLAGRLAVYAGIIMIAAGMFIGFGAMLLKAGENAIQWIGLVPLGFAVLLLGTTMTQLSRPGKKG